MIRLNANISKKVPIPGTQFSSQQFGAAVEIEVSDADKPEALKARLQSLYALLSETVDQQIAAAAAPSHNGGNGHTATPAAAQPVPNRLPAPAKGAAAKTTGATQAQQKAIWAISKSLGLELADVLADFNVVDPKDLSVKTASQVIDALKARQNAQQ